MSPDEPLQYPSHYPPTDRWQRFFVGVRWLGPDLSFFRRLRLQQAARSPSQLSSWGGGARQTVATEVGAVFSRRLRWPTPYFLPSDNMSVIASGPRFNTIDGGLDVEDAIGEIEEFLMVKMPKAFWQDAGSLSLGDVVDRLLAAGAAPNYSIEPT